MPGVGPFLAERRRSLIALFFSALSAAAFTFFPTWSAGVYALNYFSLHWFSTLLALSVLAVVARWKFLKTSPRPLAVPLLFIFFYLLVFRSRFMPHWDRYTFMATIVFIHFSMGYLIAGLEPTVRLWKFLGEKHARLRSPVAGFALAVLAVISAQIFISPTVTGTIPGFLLPRQFILIFLLPLLTSLRRVGRSRTWEYDTGILLYLILGGGALYIYSLLGLSVSMILISFLAAAWIHVYWEEFLSKTLKMDSLKKVWAAGEEDRREKLEKAKIRMGEFSEQGKGRAAEARLFLEGHREKILLGFFALGVLGLGLWLAPKIYRTVYVTVTEFTPSGLVPDRAVIRISFSEPVSVISGSIRQVACFKIEPPILGTYRQDTDRTIVFVPDETLKPSTRYKVAFDPKNLTAAKSIQGKASIEFYTTLFAVESVRLSYEYDFVSEEKMRVIGEIRFNMPVTLEEVKKHIQVTRKDKPLPVDLERSHRPDRFFIKSNLIPRKKKEQVLTFLLAKGLSPQTGRISLESDYKQDIVLPSRIKPAVVEINNRHEPGSTWVSLLFNLPVSETEVRRHLSVSPPAAYTIETEYAYAVLKGDFKPNVNYRIKISSGLITRSGDILEDEWERTLTLQDLPASVSFAHKGNFLSLNGPKTLEVKTVNLDRVNVSIEKIFRNNLLQFLNSEEYPPLTGPVFNGSYAVDGGRINEELSRFINLKDFNDKPYKGLFSIRLTDPRGYASSKAWYLCTDLGLTAKASGDDLIVYVNSVETLRPAAGVSVELYSANNQVMDKKTTDESGRLTFVNWRKNEYRFYPQFLVAKKDDDFSFLNFNRTEINAYQFDISGAPHNETGMEAFLTPERGVYRPGETAHVTAVVRNNDGSLPPALPVHMEIRDPRGGEYKRIETRANDNGVLTADVFFPLSALTGQYSLRLFRPDNSLTLGSVSLKVEEFIPDKLKVEVIVPQKPLSGGQPLTFTVQARQMFGPAAAGNRVEARVRLYSREFTHPDYKNFRFFDGTQRFEQDEIALGQSKTDDKGQSPYSVEVPEVNLPSALKAYVYAEVYDSGGRPVSAAGHADINPYPDYIGVEMPSQGVLQTKTPVTFRYVAVSGDGKPVTIPGARLVVKRKVYYSIFRRSSWGRSNYQSAAYEEVVDNKEITIDKKGTYTFTPDLAGEYTILLASPRGMRTSLPFQVLGSGYDTTSLESPEKLKMVLDKDAYDVGEEAKIVVQAPFAGRLLLTLEREKVYETRVVELTGRRTVVSFPVTDRDIPNMYVVGLLMRTPDEKNRTLPMVSFGVATLNVKKTSKKISLEWDTASRVHSRDGIDVNLRVSGGAGTDVVLAAVDEGILQITNFQTPDPLEVFYRKRGLTTRSYTMMDLMLPDLAQKKLAIGGDDGNFTRRHLNPVAAKKKKSLALFSGILTPDANGNVKYRFDVKKFNGEVRLMALAVRKDKYGAAAKSIQVADPIVLLPHFPRAAGPSDQFQIPVEVFNKTGKGGTFTVRVKAEGPAKITGDKQKTIALENETGGRVLFTAEADNDAGVVKFRVSAEGNGFSSDQEDELAVRPAAPLLTRVEQGTIQPGKSEDVEVPAGLISFGQRIRLSVSGNPLIKYLRSLDYLISYPYGCAEQTASRVFPLIYFKNLGYATGRFGDKAGAVDRFVQEGIEKLEKMQRPNGDVVYWPGGINADYWLTLYVSHFLLEAKNQGYIVSPAALDRVMNFVQRGDVSTYVDTRRTRYDGGEGDEGGESENYSENENGENVPAQSDAIVEAPNRLDRRALNARDTRLDAYLLYLKALMGRPDKEAMTSRYVNNIKNLGETDRAFLSMAYSQIGDRETALKILTPDFKSKFIYRELHGAFNSPLRNTGMYLNALAMADPQSSKIPQIVEYIGQQMKNGHFGSTQENAWVFMALSRVFGLDENPMKGRILADGAPYKSLEGREFNFSFDSPSEDSGGHGRPKGPTTPIAGKKLTLKNDGDKNMYFHIMSEGTPLAKREKSLFNGIKIQRSYKDEKGDAVNLTNVVQGDLVVVTLAVTAEKNPVQNVAVVDVLPAGFEIENPRLRSRGDLGFDPPMTFNPAYEDIRDDRILLFTDQIAGTQYFSYTVRAVTPGRFSIPNAYAEAMYDPDINGESHEPDFLIVADAAGRK